MSIAWKQTQERSKGWVLSVAFYLALMLGRGIARLALIPICLYFYVFSPKVKRSMRPYFRQVLGRNPKPYDYIRHYYTFGSVILDRVFFLSGRDHLFQMHYHHPELMQQLKKNQKGALILSAHLGSFEALRVMGQSKQLPIKILMHTESTPVINQRFSNIEDASLKETAQDFIIPMGKPDSLLKTQEWIEDGGMVGILADRAYNNKRTTSIPFLGENAEFADGAFRLAGLLQVPVVFCCAVYDKKNQYQVFFESLSSGNDIDPRKLQEAYVKTLERYTQMYPYNWFNFYDYWKLV